VRRSTSSNNNNQYSDIPHKRSNSKTLSSGLTHDTDEHHLISSGPLVLQAMPRYQKSDIWDSIHLTRRRRLSIKSSCGGGVGGCTYNECKDEDADDDANKQTKPSSSPQVKASNDIRRELQLEDPIMDLPDHTIHESPEVYLQKLVKVMCHGRELEVKKARSLEGFFARVTEAQMEAYTIAVVSVVRNNDLAGLKELHSKGQVLNCFNRFGESLLHMACRRGFDDMVEFLLGQPEMDIRICDDNGRTVLHDACWNPSPQLKICQRILERDPTLFFIADNRGCSAFQYARPEHWDIWRKFLLDNKESLTALNQPDVLERLAKVHY
jgi:Ankyrin repeats (3 copies)